jgi:hypothetical protein
MGESIEVIDVNGFTVWVPLYATLGAIGRKLEPGESINVQTGPGLHVEVRLVKEQSNVAP